jgi:hypothetical protein
MPAKGCGSPTEFRQLTSQKSAETPRVTPQMRLQYSVAALRLLALLLPRMVEALRSVAMGLSLSLAMG